ncbi:MAG: hypothetical protein ACQES1_11085 [Bacteroidota bacterium]
MKGDCNVNNSGFDKYYQNNIYKTGRFERVLFGKENILNTNLINDKTI